jgi:hypothetical protein
MDIHVRIVELIEKEKSFCLATVLASNIADVRTGRKAVVFDNGAVEGSLGSTHKKRSRKIRVRWLKWKTGLKFF